MSTEARAATTLEKAGSRSYIDLFSDSQTRPSSGMRQAMASAVVGDEQSDEDPTTLRLCAAVAELLGMEAGVFLPSGTMCNLISILVHTQPGDEVVCDHAAHIYGTEAAGAAAIAGVSIRPVFSPHGVFGVEDLARAVRSTSRTAPRTKMLSVEQSTNFTGGAVWSLDQLQAVRDFSKARGMRCHMDVARLLNAVAATGVNAAELVRGWDSAWLDLTKGLACPVGAVLCGSKDFVDQAWQWKYRLGGAMRQSGVLAAAGLYALEHYADQAAKDNANAKVLHRCLSASSSFQFDPPAPATNIVRFAVDGFSPSEFSKACASAGVRVRAIDEQYLRAVCHLDVSEEEVRRAAGVMVRVATCALHAVNPATA